jgi:hypothetical protein
VGPGSRKWKNDCWVVGCLGGCPGQFFGKNRLGFVWGFPSGNIKKKTGSGTFVENWYCKNLYRKNLYRPTSLTTTVHSSQIAMAFASPSASAPRSDATGSPSTEHSALDDAKSRLKFGARYESLQDIVKDVEFIRSGEVRSAWPVL